MSRLHLGLAGFVAGVAVLFACGHHPWMALNGALGVLAIWLIARRDRFREDVR